MLYPLSYGRLTYAGHHSRSASGASNPGVEAAAPGKVSETRRSRMASGRKYGRGPRPFGRLVCYRMVIVLEGPGSSNGLGVRTRLAERTSKDESHGRRKTALPGAAGFDARYPALPDVGA